MPEMTLDTWIEVVMWWMKARKQPTQATTSRNASVTETCGTKADVSP